MARAPLAIFTVLLWALLLALAARTSAQAAESPQSVATNDYADWAAVVIAGDWRAHGGGETQAFDNTRRDVSAALVKVGFDPAHILQYSLRPPKPGDDPAVVTTPLAAMEHFQGLAEKARGGCLFYLTSHGSPDGAAFGPTQTLTALKLGRLLDGVCPGRPTVAIVSACFSGNFASTLGDANRMVMTAARPDRSSFGCGDSDRYPFFDACILESLPESTDFLALSHRTKACVARRETEQHLEPPSEPQTFVGSAAMVGLPFMRFRRH